MKRAALAAALVLAGCQNTGIVIEVVSDPDSGPSQVHKLSVYAGYQNLEDTTFSYRDGDPLRDVILDRDLRDGAYTVLLKRGDIEDRHLVLVAISRDESGQLDGFGYVTDVHFRQGEFRKYTVALGSQPEFLDEGETCVRFSDDGLFVEIGLTGDLDCDGSADGDDCEPTNPFVSPNKTEDCENGIDDDCDGLVDVPTDHDDDGFESCGGNDCDDHKASVNPGMPEICNGFDDNCDGRCDDEFDVDGDGFLSDGCYMGIKADCQPGPEDCDDGVDGDVASATIFPGADELCDGLDNDCDSQCDEDFDQDGDGFLGPACVGTNVLVDCSPGRADCFGGSGDDDPLINPGMPEICDGIDNDCNDNTVERETAVCFERDGIGDCYAGVSDCMDGLAGACFVEFVPESIVPDEFCDAADQCAGDPDPLACLESVIAGGAKTLKCRLTVSNNLTACDPSTARLPSVSSDPADMCTMNLLGGSPQQKFELGVRPFGSGVPANSAQSCTAEAVVNNATDPPDASVAFIFWEELNNSTDADGVVLMEVQVDFLEPLEQCPDAPGMFMCGPLVDGMEPP